MFPALSQLLTNAIRSLMYLLPCVAGLSVSLVSASRVLVSIRVSYRDDDD
jgi:hypothetical protein